jgi:hypothetical protein
MHVQRWNVPATTHVLTRQYHQIKLVHRAEPGVVGWRTGTRSEVRGRARQARGYP